MNEYRYSEIYVGQEESFRVTVTSEMEDSFRGITGDINPMHLDDRFAVGGGYFKHVAFGMLTASFLSTLAGVYLPGKHSLLHSIDSIRFKKPVYAGDTLMVTARVFEKQDGLGLIRNKVTMRNQDNQVVLQAEMKVLVLK